MPPTRTRSSFPYSIIHQIAPTENSCDPSYIVHAAFHSMSHSSSLSATVLVFLLSLLYTSTRFTFPTDQGSLCEFESVMGDNITATDLFIVSCSTAAKFLFDIECVAALSKFWEGVGVGARTTGWLANLERRFLKSIQWNLTVSPTELHDWTTSIIQVVMSGSVLPVMYPSSTIVTLPNRNKRPWHCLPTPAELCEPQFSAGDVQKVVEQQQQYVGLVHAYDFVHDAFTSTPTSITS